MRFVQLAAIWAVAMFVVTVAHELGHAVAALCIGGRVDEFTVGPFGGGRVRADTPGAGQAGEAFVQAGGILMNLLFAAVVLPLSRRARRRPLLAAALAAFGGLSLVGAPIYLFIGLQRDVGDPASLLRLYGAVSAPLAVRIALFFCGLAATWLATRAFTASIIASWPSATAAARLLLGAGLVSPLVLALILRVYVYDPSGLMRPIFWDADGPAWEVPLFLAALALVAAAATATARGDVSAGG